MTMPNYVTIRRDAQAALDDLSVHSALAGATFQTVGSILLASSAANLSVDRYNGRWLYHIPASGMNQQQRQVVKGSYVASTGFVTVAPGWAAPLENEQLEMTALFPCFTPPFAAETSYARLIRRSMQRLSYRDRVTVAITTSQTYTLSASFPWLDREERLLAVLEPGITGGAPVDASWRRPRLIRDGGAVSLILDVPFITASGSISLDVLRPGDTLIGVNGGAYAESTVGLVNETDLTPLPVSEIIPVFLEEAYAVLATRANTNPSVNWAQRLKDQRPLARAVASYDWSQEPGGKPATEAAA